ncbi:unnamed protein product [Pleuronectes platessa]|uniref:Uncharacterized protein n=1 Tax=Pleuronectes platessa TaxID=8262 RepID=A0A9N7YJI3_PLEPL|nr:unnamed protein product [Pleuronectes platessa]
MKSNKQSGVRASRENQRRRYVTSCPLLLCENGRRSWQAERRSHREPLSGCATLIRGQRSAANYVCISPALPGNSSSLEEDEETTSAHFPQHGNGRGTGGGGGDYTHPSSSPRFVSVESVPQPPALTTFNELRH